MSFLIDTTEIGNNPFQEEYATWRRQRKYYKSEIKRLKGEVSQMQEKLDGLEQKQLQGDLSRGRNAMKKSKNSKFNHCNMEVISTFCKKRMFSVYKFLEQSMLIYSSSHEQSLCVKLSKEITKPKELDTAINHEFYWSNNIVPMINKKYVELRSNFNMEVKRVYLGKFKDVV
jgi:hypothetical protein